MQSFLQYRHFGAAVRAQQARDQSKADALIRGNREISQNQAQNLEPSGRSSSTIRGGEEREVEKDIEKAEAGPSESSPDSHHNGGAMAKETEEAEAADPDVVDPDGDLRDQLNRVATSHSRYSENTALGLALTGIHVRDRSTRDGGSGQVFVVGYEGEQDPLNPHSWSYSRRFMYTFIIATIGFVVGVASAIDSSALPQASMEFGVSQVVESMATG